VYKESQQLVDSFGCSLRQVRESKGYSREQVAGRAEISPRYLAAIENDNRKPSLDVLVRIVYAMGASFDEIFGFIYTRTGETALRICRLTQQCSQRDQELVLALVDQMLDKKKYQANPK
jgi:transcriptional regulator with XRE-family HTH domain